MMERRRLAADMMERRRLAADMTPRVVAVVGPTASGKTGLAVALARALGGDVVNADSMQLYAGMDVGTAKATTAERDGVPHHLFDIWSPAREASVADYQRRAREVIDGLLDAGTSAVLVGGSGLYLRAVLDELEFPGTDAAVRARLEAELASVGGEVMHARLGTLDPAAAAVTPAANGRRVVRALEVIELTGRPFSANLPSYGRERWGAVQLGLDPPLDVLDERILTRVQRMWADGLVDEVRALAADPGLGVTASRALGYAQVLAWLEAGGDPAGEAAAREKTFFVTRRYVRRQRSWFRRDPRISWLPAGALLQAYAGSPSELLASALAQLTAIHPIGSSGWA